MPVLALCSATVRHGYRIAASPKSPAITSVFGFDERNARLASSASIVEQRPRRSILPHLRSEPNVDPNSLSETLEAHREANRASLIHRVYGKGHKIESIKVASRIQRRVQQREHLVRHLNLQKAALRSRRRTASETPGSAEYNGKDREVSRQWTLSSSLSHREMYPWVGHISKPAAFANDQLNAEIRAFGEYMSPSAQEKQAASRAMSDLFACIQSAAPSVEIDVIGSQETGLATPFSDIDLNVAPTNPVSGVDAFALLGYLAKEMRKKRANPYHPRPNPVRVNIFIDHAKVPIISGVHVPTGLDFQIQSATECFASMEHTMAYVSEFPTLRALFLVLKQMLKMRGLMDGSQGGLTSYPLIGMIVAALKFSEGKVGKQDVGRQLLYFLDMYADIDFYTTGISISPLQYTTKRTRDSLQRDSPTTSDHAKLSPWLPDLAGELATTKWRAVLNPSRPFQMCLQDPANAYNDLGRGAIQIKHIQATIVTARNRIRDNMKVWEASNDTGVTDRVSRNPILAWPLGGDYRIFEQDRQELRQLSLESTTLNGPSDVDQVKVEESAHS